MELTSEQKKVINFKDGNLQIIACAGSGKTTSISKRIANLIDSGVRPGNIVAFTFTEKAAEVMKYKIGKFVSELNKPVGDIGELYVGTIHGYCFELLKKYKPEFLSYDVLDDNQRILFIKKHYFELGLDNPEIRHTNFTSNRFWWTTIKNVIKNIDVIREEKVSISKLSNKDFKTIFEKYNEILHREKYLDFSSIMAFAVTLLEDDFEILTEVRKKVDYLIVDEYQDINPIQERLIELISMKSNVCVVGDDDQSIYQWRGTKVNNILTFQKRYQKVKQIELVDNFRSSPAIIKHANSVINKMGKDKRLEKEMKWGNKERIYEQGDVYSVFFPNESNETDFIIEKIKNLYGKKFRDEEKGKPIDRALDWKDFALIFRSVSKHSKPFIERLKQEKIPYVVKGSIGLFEREEIELILRIMAFILEPDFEINSNLEDDDSRRLFSNLFEGRGKKYDLFLYGVKRIKNSIKNNRYVNLQRIFQQILEVLGIKEHSIREEIMYNLAQMSIVISDYEGQYFPIRKTPKKLAEFFEFLEEHGRYSYEEGGHEEKFGGVNAVQIMTMHRCKGLEFPVVFLPALTKQVFPNHSSDRSKWFIDEKLVKKAQYATSEDNQRRLLYVAMTRSMKYLFVTCSLRMAIYDRQQKPSEFIADFSDDMILHKPIDDPTKREKCNNFVNITAESFPTNFSELGFYYDCPYDFKLRQVLGFNPIIDPMLGYGKSIHNILNNIHKLKQRGKKIDVDSVIDKNFKLRFAKKEDEDKSKTKADKVIKNYLDNYKEDFDFSLETEKPFEIMLGNVMISGQIDLIKRNTPQGEEITIVEFKTELEPDEFRKTKHKDQALLYGLAYQKAFSKTPHKLFVHYLDEGGKNRIPVDLNKENTDKLIGKIEDIVEHIKRGNFPRKPYIHSRCSNCNFKKICKGG